jgi:hypothetical protein
LATIAGGQNNLASGADSSIGGGKNNEVSGDYGTIAGGNDNEITANFATISGGEVNGATGLWSMVGGGYSNVASADGSSIPGGVLNAAAGNYSLAAGYRAKANADGVFALADSTDADFTVATANVFGARFSGGYWLTGGDVGIGTTGPLSALQIEGYLQIDYSATTPAAADCNEATETGRMFYEDDVDTLWVCQGVGGWASH